MKRTIGCLFKIVIGVTFLVLLFFAWSENLHSRMNRKEADFFITLAEIGTADLASACRQMFVQRNDIEKQNRILYEAGNPAAIKELYLDYIIIRNDGKPTLFKWGSNNYVDGGFSIPDVIKKFTVNDIMIYKDQVSIRINSMRKYVTYFPNKADGCGDVMLYDGLWFRNANNGYPPKNKSESRIRVKE